MNDGAMAMWGCGKCERLLERRVTEIDGVTWTTLYCPEHGDIFTSADAGDLDLGLVRESAPERTNDLEFFFEEFTCVTSTGCDAEVRAVPCVPIECPPMEEFAVSWVVIRCPECGMVPEGSHSIFDDPNNDIVWTCLEHGVLDIGRPT